MNKNLEAIKDTHLSKDDIKRFEYWVTDMKEHLFLRDNGIRYNFVKVIGKTTVYKYPRTNEVLSLAKQYILNNNSKAEYWIADMQEHIYMKQHNIKYAFVKVIDGLTIYKYPKTIQVFNAALDYTDIITSNNNSDNNWAE